MTITVCTDVFCDECGFWDDRGTVADVGARVREARAKARTLGWTHRGGMDLCPECSKVASEP